MPGAFAIIGNFLLYVVQMERKATLLKREKASP